MDLLIDSNVVLDYMLERGKFFPAAEQLFEILSDKNNSIKGYVSASAVTDIYYIAYRTLKNHEQVRELLAEVLKVIKVAAVTEENINHAFNLNWKDFEDAVQYSVALANGMDAVITRNMKGFSTGEVKICTPEEFLEH